MGAAEKATHMKRDTLVYIVKHSQNNHRPESHVWYHLPSSRVTDCHPQKSRHFVDHQLPAQLLPTQQDYNETCCQQTFLTVAFL